MHLNQFFVSTSVPDLLGIGIVALAGTTQVRVSGEVDISTADVLDEALSTAVARRPELVEVDLADVPFMDSTGMSVLVRARQAAVEAGCRFRVVRPQRGVCRGLQTLDLLAILGL